MNIETINSIELLKTKTQQTNGWTDQEWENAKEEYLRFLQLVENNPQSSLAPSTKMDAVWHSHILNTKAYAQDCDSLFGRFLHHQPHLEEGECETNSAAYTLTKRLYAAEFGQIMVESSRCDGKACHVESNCRCR